MPASPEFPNLPQGWTETTESLQPLGTFYRMWAKSPVTDETRSKEARVLFLVHGFGEHSDRYRHWPAYLNDHFDIIATSDLYGHGRSPGAKGSCRSSEDWLGGVELALKHTESFLRREGRRFKMVALGHSFGGLLALELARQNRWHSVKHLCLSAPLLGLVHEPPIWKTLLGKVIEPLLPQLPLANDISPTVVSKENSVVQWYLSDPLNHGLITPRAYQQMTELMMTNFKNTNPLTLPVTLILPGSDPLVNSNKTAEWFTRLETKPDFPKKRLDFAGLRHESFNEVEREQVFSALGQAIQT